MKLKADYYQCFKATILLPQIPATTFTNTNAMLTIKQILHGFMLLVLFSLQTSIVNASSVQQVAVDDMLEIAELIFEGRVTAVESRWNNGRTAINTLVTFNIIDVIHGDYANSSIVLQFAGGSADGLTMQIEGIIYPQLGETGIYFIEETDRALVNPIVGWSQGHFLISEDANGEQRMLTAEREPIIEMNDDPAPAQALSEGVAAGLITNKSAAQVASGMSKTSFKQQLKAKLSNQPAR